MNRRVADYLISVIHFYQRIAPAWIRGCCRYTPSCSDYTILVIRERGAMLGSLLALGRILRCVPPFGGVDWPGNAGRSCSTSKGEGGP